jgi:hypothetical protein
MTIAETDGTAAASQAILVVDDEVLIRMAVANAATASLKQQTRTKPSPYFGTAHSTFISY